jgi:hypothetical protein
MEAMRVSRADERLDDLDPAGRRRFREWVEARLERLDERLHAIVCGFVGMTAAIVGGFAAIVGLIATQLRAASGGGSARASPG